ncbi:MAG TPA: hypothetical protein VH643_03885 [Gemmataceae bacterium]|jgi:type II secretory pathway component PulF
MSQETSRRSLRLTLLLLIVSAVLWASVVVVLVFAVPRYERDFREQAVRLPEATVWALAAGHWANNYWYVLPLFGLLILPVILLLSWLLRHQVRTRWPGWLWFGALLGVPLLLQLAVWWALLLP